MDKAEILNILSSSSTSPKESASTASLRHKAHDLISSSGNKSSQLSSLPETLLELLTQIIKPLFSSTKHPSLTSTGRKNLLPGQHSSSGIPVRFSTSQDFFDQDADDALLQLKPWRTTRMTIPLLRYILQTYSLIEPAATLRKATLEAHFHLLVPAVLNLIDDGDADYKAAGCSLLRRLCEALCDVQSEIVRRTGLGDVFADALKANFMLLPTLTPEEESLAVLPELYPAYLALVDAWFVGYASPAPSDHDTATAASTTPKTTTTTTTKISGDESLRRRRNQLLTALYRHGVLASLTHLSSSSAGTFSTTISAPLTSFLLSQIPPVFERMGLSSVTHLQTLLPMLRGGLMDPFSLAAPAMVSAALDVLRCVLVVCAPRVRDRWAPEILRGLVGCWCNLVDEARGDSVLGGTRGGKDDNKDNGAAAKLEELKQEVRRAVKMLGNVMAEQRREDWNEWTEKLIAEDADLKELFDD